jgi:PadR family transcriptional regulator, regulatory protein AphA
MISEAMPTEYALLGLLLDGPKHGYELARRFSPETALGEICHLEMSMLYALLKKQEKADHIEAELESPGARPPKRIFHLTALGRAAFMEWVRTPVGRSRDIRLDFLVKLYFARQLGVDDVLALIDRQLEICLALLDRLQRGISLNEDIDDVMSISAGNYSGFDYNADDDLNLRPGGKRSHPRPSEQERNRNRTVEEDQFAQLVQQLRIKQNEATIEWLRASRRQLGSY